MRRGDELPDPNRGNFVYSKDEESVEGAVFLLLKRHGRQEIQA